MISDGDLYAHGVRAGTAEITERLHEDRLEVRFEPHDATAILVSRELLLALMRRANPGVVIEVLT